MKRIIFCTLIFIAPFFMMGQTTTDIEENPSSEARFPGCERPDLMFDDRVTCAHRKMEGFLISNLKYPDAALEKELSGVVSVVFIVEADGSLSDIQLLEASNAVFEEEAIRLTHSMPSFVPAMKGKTAVSTRKEISIQFELPTGKKVKKSKKRDLRREMAKTRIETLKNGILTVRLQTNRNKIAALKKLAENGNVAKRSEYKKQLDQLIFDRDSINNELVTYFSDPNYFSFCEVRFFYDDQNLRYAKEETSGYFVDENLEIDPSITLDKPGFLTYIGTTPISEDARTVYTAFVIKNALMNPLSSPFPAYINFRVKLASDKSQEFKFSIKDIPLPQAIQKLNRVLHGFHEKVQAW